MRESQGGRPISEAINGELAYIRLDPMPAAMPARSARGELHRARHILTMRIHVGRDEAGKRAPVDIALPVIQHRAFEPSLFKFATLRREREGSQFKWSVTFTCTTSETINEPLADIPARLAGINFGWRSTPDGLRIATIVDAQGQV